MRKSSFFTVVIVLFLAAQSFGQRYTISGYIEDSSSGEKLIAASVYKDIFSFSKSRIKVILNPPAAEDVIISYERSGYFKKWLNQ